MAWIGPLHKPDEGETHEQAVLKVVDSLKAIFHPPWEDLTRQEKHDEGECTTCDAERWLACTKCGGVGVVVSHGPEDYGTSFECESCECPLGIAMDKREEGWPDERTNA